MTQINFLKQALRLDSEADHEIEIEKMGLTMLDTLKNERDRRKSEND